MQFILPYLANFAAFIVPLLVSFISKNSDKYLDKIFSKLGSLISARAGKSAAVIVSTNPKVYVEFCHNDGDIIKRIAPDDGVLTFDDHLEHGDKVYVKAYGDGFKEEDMTVHIDNEFVTYCVSLKLDKI